MINPVPSINKKLTHPASSRGAASSPLLAIECLQIATKSEVLDSTKPTPYDLPGLEGFSDTVCREQDCIFDMPPDCSEIFNDDLDHRREAKPLPTPCPGPQSPEWIYIEPKARRSRGLNNLLVKLEKFNVPDDQTEEFVQMFEDLNLLDGKCLERHLDGKRWNLREARRRLRKRGLEPHAGSSSSSRSSESPPTYDPRVMGQGVIDALQSMDMDPESMGPEYKEWIDYLENLVILAYELYRGESMSDVIVAFVIYMKLHCRGALTVSIASLLSDYYSVFPKGSDDDDILPHSLSLGSVKDGWEILKTNTIFEKISYLITAAMSFSVCSIRKISWSPLGVKVIALEAQKEQVVATDFIDALIKTFCWICETGYQCFRERSLYPILYGDQRMREFNEECDYILAAAEQAVAGNVDDINDFERRVGKVLATVCELKILKPNGPTAIWLQTRYAKLVEVQFKLRAKHANTALRFAPIGFGITGPTGVGKSTLATMTMRTSLNAMGYPSTSDGIITKDMFDKYDSTYTSDILGVFFDDVGNGKPEFAVASPTDVIIKFFNNVSAQAVKAELNAKGVVFVAFKCGVMTSNHADYGVNNYSNCPESILRRFIHVRVSVLEEFRKPGSMLLDSDHPALRSGELTKNIWSIDMEECSTFENAVGKSSYRFTPLSVKLEGGILLCSGLTITQYLDVVIHLSQKHKRAQDSVLERAEIFNSATFCERCMRPTTLCTCVSADAVSFCTKCTNLSTNCKCNIEPHSLVGDAVESIVKKAVSNYVGSIFQPWKWYSRLFQLFGWKPVHLITTKMLQCELEQSLAASTPGILAMLPDCIFQNRLTQKIVDRALQVSLKRDLDFQIRVFSYMGCLGSLVCAQRASSRKGKLIDVLGCALGVSSFIGGSYFSAVYREARLKTVKSEYIARRDALPTFAERVKTKHLAGASCAAGAILFGLKLFKMWNDRRLIEAHSVGNLNSDSSPRWFEGLISRMPFSLCPNPCNKGATIDQVVATFEKSNLFWAKFEHDDSKFTNRCNVFFPRKGVVMMPAHVWHVGSDLSIPRCSRLRVTVYRSNKPGGVLSFVLDDSVTVFPHEYDLAVGFVPNCPDLRTQTKWFPEGSPQGMAQCKLMVKQPDHLSVVEAIEVNFRPGTGHCQRNFEGGQYISKKAENGYCMGLIISDTLEPHIVGFHIGGNKYGQCVCQSLTQSTLQRYIKELSCKSAVLLSAEGSEVPSTQYGKPVIDHPTIHPHCMAASLTSDHVVEVLGSTRLRTKQRSCVEPSILAPHVESVMEVKNIWGPPQMAQNWKCYNTTLEYLVDPPSPFNPCDLERARQDWLCPLLDLAAFEPPLDPLSFQEAIMGVPGKRFLDPLCMSTGMGFPVFGKKQKWFIEYHNERGVLMDRVPSQPVKDECDRIMACWERGERAYPVFSSCLKDEPTKLESTKVRVFQASAVASSIWVRKYFLPIIRFMCQHPLEAECAVGLNATGTDWHHIYEHATQYNDEDLLAWDYSKFDVRMGSQVTLAAYSCMIDLAEALHYSDKDLYIMRMMIADCVHPLLDFNGTLLMALSSNPSGINTTVTINSIVGSLYVRLGFFHSCPDEHDFRRCVAAMTYGDDFIGSVHERYSHRFNYIIYKQFLQTYGIKITPPNKSETESPFLPAMSVDFLKRHNTYIPELQTCVGALDEMSIVKSLCSNVKSKVASRTDVAVSCIEGALNEYFFHGRQTYDFRRSQLKEICSRERANIPLSLLDLSFDERVRMWKEKYKDT